MHLHEASWTFFRLKHRVGFRLCNCMQLSELEVWKNNVLPPVNWRWVEEGDGYVGHCSPLLGGPLELPQASSSGLQQCLVPCPYRWSVDSAQLHAAVRVWSVDNVQRAGDGLKSQGHQEEVSLSEGAEAR